MSDIENLKTNLANLRDLRIEKIESLKKLGINSYPSESHRTNVIKEIVDSFDEFENKEVTLAGRLMSIREHGQLVFGDIMDQDAKIQLYIKSDIIKDTDKKLGCIGFSDLHLLDIGDFVEANGIITKTQRGEISILVKSLRLLSKSLRPLPDKWNKITDKETRYRKRYLDFTMNVEHRALFQRKAKFWSLTREFLKDHGFIEVETPVLELKTGGADAKPFITHHNDLDLNLYLRISTELYQKRLIGGGFEKIYTLGPNFRNEGVDDEHIQEYYQMEWYVAYKNYKYSIDLCKKYFIYLAEKLYGKTKFETRGHTFDLNDEWEIIDYQQVIKDKFNIDILKATDDEMLKIIKDNGISLSGAINRNRLIDNIWKIIRKEISGPAFLVNHPKLISPLAKSFEDNESITERFQPIIAGSELGNGYSEINDPKIQYEQFKLQEEARLKGDDESQMMDMDFIEMLEYGMPPVTGFGSSERVFWFFEDISAREGTLFPLMKPIYNNLEIEKGDNEIKSKIKPMEEKIAFLIQKDLEGWQLANLVGKLSIGILQDENNTSESYVTKDGKVIPVGADYPIVTLSASSQQMNNLLNKLDSSIRFFVITKDMMSSPNKLDIANKISEKNLTELEIVGIALFGKNDKINSLTKKFSLWK